MSWRVVVWFCVVASVFVWCRSVIVVISPWSVCWNVMAIVGVKVCWIWLMVVFAFIVNSVAISIV